MQLTVSDEIFETKNTKPVANGTVYTVQIDKKDFCIFESHEEKAEKEIVAQK